mgnify:CR=1 FL=1
MIRVSKSSISNKEIESVKKVLKNQFLGMGPEVKRFEDLLRKFFKRDVCCFNSGTAALQIALQSCGIGRGDEVLVPCITYVATYQAISATGAKPILCDIDIKSLDISIEDAERKFTKKTRAIIPVHFSGHPCNLKKIYRFSKVKKIKVIEDSAHAFGSVYKNKKIGSQGFINCFSFDGIKNITSGEGGCLVTNEKKIIEKAKVYRSLGVINESELRYKKKRNWDYNVKSQGWRYHMSDINAAIGISQLKRFKKLARKRQMIAKKYDVYFKKYKKLVSVFSRDYKKEVPHIYCLIINKTINRNYLRNELLKNKIETGVHYKPGYYLDYYKSNKKNFPNCEKIQKKIITLPIHPGITNNHIKKITKTLVNLLNKSKK